MIFGSKEIASSSSSTGKELYKRVLAMLASQRGSAVYNSTEVGIHQHVETRHVGQINGRRLTCVQAEIT